MAAYNAVNDFQIIKVVQASHHQGDVRYGNSRGIQCSCMSLMSVSWTLFKSPGFWDKFDLDSILQNGDELFKSIDKQRYLGVDDLPPQQFFIKNSAIDIDYLENRTTAGAYNRGLQQGPTTFII